MIFWGMIIICILKNHKKSQGSCPPGLFKRGVIMRKINFFLIHILVGTIILFSSFKTNNVTVSRILLFAIIALFSIALFYHFKEIEELERKSCGIDCLKLLVGSFFASAITWYINHRLGLGPIIANGLVGVVASLLFRKNSGAYYVASFIGMSSQAVIPSMIMSGLAGILAGLVIVFSKEIYHGIGGKGGTIAAFSAQISSIIVSFFT